MINNKTRKAQQSASEDYYRYIAELTDDAENAAAKRAREAYEEAIDAWRATFFM